MRDVVADGVTGRLVASDPTQIAAAMVQILTDPALADAMGAAAGRRGRDDASWAGVAERALEAYGEVLGGRSLSGQLGR
jgi:glycosyltransferase involved in cell wall biosynthesis